MSVQISEMFQFEWICTYLMHLRAMRTSVWISWGFGLKRLGLARVRTVYRYFLGIHISRMDYHNILIIISRKLISRMYLQWNHTSLIKNPCTAWPFFFAAGRAGQVWTIWLLLPWQGLVDSCSWWSISLWTGSYWRWWHMARQRSIRIGEHWILLEALQQHHLYQQWHMHS